MATGLSVNQPGCAWRAPSTIVENIALGPEGKRPQQINSGRPMAEDGTWKENGAKTERLDDYPWCAGFVRSSTLPPSAVTGEIFRTFQAFQSGKDASHSKTLYAESRIINPSVTLVF